MSKLHIVANSHIDPVWLWDKFEGIDEVLNTFRSACNRLDEYPELCFTASSIQFYEWVQQFDGVLFERIVQKINEGRWEVAGGWWVEADTNLPLAESFSRHAEISQAFAQKHFGRKIEVAYLPDTFGHPATLPKILAEQGFKYFIFCRPNIWEKPDLPANLFRWEYEGSEILAYRLKFHYLQHFDEPRLREILDDDELAAKPVACHLFGVGDHGGGPSVQEIEFYRRAIAEKPPRNMAFSTCERFFKDAEKLPEISRYSGDLHMHAVGCYSVVRNIKQSARSAERLLSYAERALEMAKQPSQVLQPYWKTTLFNQFHDILPGSCSPAAAGHACDELGGVTDAARNHSYRALKQISRTRKPSAPEAEFRIFNTLPYEVTVPLAIESFMYFREGSTFRDDSGRVIEIQETTPSVRCANRRWQFIDTLPPNGFKAYHFDQSKPLDPAPERFAGFRAGREITVGETRINDTEGISRASGGQPAASVHFLLLDDTSDTWGHGVDTYDKVLQELTPATTAVSTGKLLSQMYQTFTCGNSRIELIYTLYRDLPGIYLDVSVNWHEQRKILKMEIRPVLVHLRGFVQQAAGGAVERNTDGKENPLHAWALMKGSSTDCAVVQDGAFACDCRPDRLRITLVRSNIYGYHDPVPLNPLDPQHHTDQGVHDFRMCLLMQHHLQPAQLDRTAAAFLEPYLVLRES